MFTRPLGTPTTGFEGQFRFMADVEGLGTAAGRHPSAQLLPVFNASYRGLREFVTSLGYTQFIRRGTTTNLPTTPVEAGESYSIIDVGTSGTPGTIPTLEQIKRVDVKVSGSDWYELPEVTLLQLRDLTPSRFFGSPSRPQGWCWLNSGSITGTTAFVKGEIAVAPVPTSGQYCLWSMSEQPDLVNTTDVWLYHTEDWAQWHMFDAMSKICGARDKDTARKLDYILNNRLNIEVPGSPAYNIATQRPTAAGPRTWTRGSNYRGVGTRR
jgi:hypothetical protein